MDQNLVTTQFVTAIITTVVQVATLIVVIIYTIYTARMTSAARASAEAANNTIKEMKEARDQENAPYIVIYFDIPTNKHLINLIIKNVGKSSATDVKLTFTPSLSSRVFKDINDTPLIKNGISSLPPNYELRILFDGVINPTLTTSEVTLRPKTWYDSVLAKLQEFILLWTCVYGKSEVNQVDSFLTDLQNKLILICGQLIAILSESPETASIEIKEAISSIAANLQVPGYKKFYIDGGASLTEFDALGDSTVQNIDSLVKQVLHEKEQVVDSTVEEQFD